MWVLYIYKEMRWENWDYKFENDSRFNPSINHIVVFEGSINHTVVFEDSINHTVILGITNEFIFAIF